MPLGFFYIPSGNIQKYMAIERDSPIRREKLSGLRRYIRIGRLLVQTLLGPRPGLGTQQLPFG